MNLISVRVILVLLSLDEYPCQLSIRINEASSLFSHLFVYGNYDKLVRPVQNHSEPVVVKMDLKLSQLLELDVKEQRLKTSLWVQQTWFDSKLSWNPEDYGGLKSLEVPSEDIWLPDLVLHNNLDGNFWLGMGVSTKAILHHNGLIKWTPPIQPNTACGVDVEYFPFDQQTCCFQFASWTHDGFKIDLQHMRATSNSSTITRGIDLSEYYPSVEWDIIAIPAIRNEKFYTCCDEPYLDITFCIKLSRKTLFHALHMIPLIIISFLTTLVFVLPSNSGEKMPLFAAILISFSVFLCIHEASTPPTSIIIPLIGKYIIFTFLLLTSAIGATTLTVKIHYRSPLSHHMSNWVHVVFIQWLPLVLCLRQRSQEKTGTTASALTGVKMEKDIISTATPLEGISKPQSTTIKNRTPPDTPESSLWESSAPLLDKPQEDPIPLSRKLRTTDGDTELRALEKKVEDMAKVFSTMLEKVGRNVESIGNSIVKKEQIQEVKNDWKFMAYVLDRLFYWIFTFIWLGGTISLVLEMNHHSSYTPIDTKFSSTSEPVANFRDIGDIFGENCIYTHDPRRKL